MLFYSKSSRYFLILIASLVIGSNFAKANTFTLIREWIESGRYKRAWQAIHSGHHQLNAAERFWLKAKIFHDQGAHYLSLDQLDSLETTLRAQPEFQKVWGEYLYTLRADVFYQLYEIGQHLKEIELLEQWRLKFYPGDSLRKAMNYTHRARYFSAIIKGDSAIKNTCAAMRLWWKYKTSNPTIPVWQLYANHVSCNRNNFGFAYDHEEKVKDSYIDTCLIYLNNWYPSGDCIEKLRIQQALIMPFFDRVASAELWKNPTLEKIQNYKKVRSALLELLNAYRKLIGTKHSHIARTEYLLGLLESYRGNNSLATRYLHDSKDHVFTYNSNFGVYCYNWSLFLGVGRLLPKLRAPTSEAFESLETLYLIKRELELVEEVFFLQYINLFANGIKPESDVYIFRPFGRLGSIHLQLFRRMRDRTHLDQAWTYFQKDKYYELVRTNLLPVQQNKFYAQSKTLMEYSRLFKKSNDSLLLSENGFVFLSDRQRNQIAVRLRRDYEYAMEVVRKIGRSDPYISQIINQKPIYTIESLQSSIDNPNVAWIAINNIRETSSIITTIWVITQDTFLVKQHFWRPLSAYLPLELHNKQKLFERDSIDLYGHRVFESIFSDCYRFLKKMGITRINYCDDSAIPLGNPETWVQGFVNGKAHYLLSDFAFTHKLLIWPDDFSMELNPKALKSRGLYSICPTLPMKYTDLWLARQYSDSLAGLFKGKSIHAFCTREEFVKTLNQASVVQLFTHGEGVQGLVFSNGNLLPDDIRNLKLNLELVGLTGCESNEGELIIGDGTKGMTEAFIGAGAKRVISTLWKIDERSSAMIMLEFYRNIRAGQPADIALQNAKLKFISRADELEQTPSFWGGILLYGSMEPLYPVSSLSSPISFKIIGTITILIFGLILLVPHYRFFSGRLRSEQRFA